MLILGAVLNIVFGLLNEGYFIYGTHSPLNLIIGIVNFLVAGRCIYVWNELRR